MKWFPVLFFLIIFFFLSDCGNSLQKDSPSQSSSSSSSAYSIPSQFVRRSGTQLVIGTNNTQILLHGVCFGNNVWSMQPLPPVDDHDSNDFTRVKNMKMNAVRFYMNYQLFEDDNAPYTYKATGWAWLDENIQWAKDNGIYLILNMHVPQGGYQSNGDGMDLWNIQENQKRLIALWKAIASRYKDETIIAGYDLVNEPVVSQSISQWTNLANQLISGIRTVDPNHLIIVERMNGVKGDWTTYGNLNFFIVDDPNMAYTFHFYSPIEYTHQLTSWTGFSNQDGGSYPDSNRIMLPSDTAWSTATFNNPALPAGDTAWTYYEGVPFKVTNSHILTAKPVCSADLNSGTAYFDDYIVKEFDQNGQFIRTIYSNNIENISGWSFWSSDGLGSYGISGTTGMNDSHSLYISNITGYANCSGDSLRFAVKTGFSYTISGWMKGAQVSGSGCRIRLDFEESPSGAGLMYRDKSYLSNELSRYIEWGKSNNVPLYLGEYGLFIENYTNNKGGLVWLRDMMDLLKASGVNFTYHDYHELGFGIYTNTGLPKDGCDLPGIISTFQSAW